MERLLRRRLLLAAALAATLAAAWYAGKEDDAPGRPTRKSPLQPSTTARPGPPAPGAAASLEAPLRDDFATETADAFPARSWLPPPPPVAAVKPPPPSAPPLPFSYIGKLIEGNSTVVFVARDQRNLALRQGDTVDGTYRVDTVTADNAVFVYLPLQQKQIMNFGRNF